MGRKTLRQLSDVLNPAGLGEEPIGAQPAGLSDVANFAPVDEYDQKDVAKTGLCANPAEEIEAGFLRRAHLKHQN